MLTAYELLCGINDHAGLLQVKNEFLKWICTKMAPSFMPQDKIYLQYVSLCAFGSYACVQVNSSATAMITQEKDKELFFSSVAEDKFAVVCSPFSSETEGTSLVNIFCYYFMEGHDISLLTQ